MMRPVVAAVGVIALSTACSAPPDKERHQADGAIAAARAADAGRYAPRALEAAEAALAGYDAAVAQRDFREALRLALEARDVALQAVRDAGDQKAAARSRAERLLADGTALLAAPDTGLVQTGPSRRPAGAASNADALAAMQEARLKLAATDYRAAVAELEPVVARLRAEREGLGSPDSSAH